MKKQLVATFTSIAMSLLVPLLTVSCVSSLLKEAPPTFSKDVKWVEPGQPFTKIGTPVYPAWKNKNSGNVISIVSDCGENSAQNLLSLHQLIESTVDEFSLVKEQKGLFQNKASIVHFSEGSVDGQPIEIQSMSFKRKDCGYLTTLSGKKNNLDIDRKAFQQFNESLTFE